MYNLKTNLLFIHVPKTGGTSIQRTFYKQFGRNKLWQPHRSLQFLLTRPGIQRKKPFSFAAVRNTWDRMVSLYHQELRHKKMYNRSEFVEFKKIGFSEWVITEGIKDKDFVQSQLYYIGDGNGAVGVSEVLRFEFLQADLNDMMDDIGLDRMELPVLNKRANSVPYRDCYTDQARDVVAEHYAAEIELFGYTF